MEELLPMSKRAMTKLWASWSASKLVGERVARQVTGRVASRVAPYVEPPCNEASPSYPGADSKRERREMIS
jgi:hypothetical protein